MTRKFNRLTKRDELVQEDSAFRQDEESPAQNVSEMDSSVAQVALVFLFGTGLFCMLITLVGNALINSNSDDQARGLGSWFWMLGGVGMLLCSLVSLAILRRDKLQWLFESVPDPSAMVSSPWFTLMLWNLLGFFALALSVVIFHVVLGTVKTLSVIWFLTPIIAGLIFSLIATTNVLMRAYWIGFVTSIVFGVFGFGFGRYMLFMIAVHQSPRSSLYQTTLFGNGLAGPAPLGNSATLGNNSNTEYTFEVQMLLAQLSILGWAMVHGLICSAVIPWWQDTWAKPPVVRPTPIPPKPSGPILQSPVY